MAPQGPSILDQGSPRRIRLGDACRAYAFFAIGAGVAMGVLLFAVAWLLDESVMIGPCAAISGPFLLAPMGCCGIAIVWRLQLGLRYSAKLRLGDFRFAAILTVALVWGFSALDEHLCHGSGGGVAVAISFLAPLFIAGLTTFFALHDRKKS